MRNTASDFDSVLKSCRIVEGAEIAELAKRSTNPEGVVQNNLWVPDEDMKVAVHDGDLIVEGDLGLGDHDEIHDLLVIGDLHVSGLFDDYDDPQTTLMVTGKMTADRVLTTGWLEVQGDLEARIVTGFYNDCSAFVGGTLRAEVFFPEEHHFDVGEAAEVAHALGNSHRISAPTKLSFKTGETLRGIVLPELLNDDIKDGLDYEAFHKRVRDNQPVMVSKS